MTMLLQEKPARFQDLFFTLVEGTGSIPKDTKAATCIWKDCNLEFESLGMSATIP